MHNPDPQAGSVQTPSTSTFDDTEPGVGEKLAYLGAEVAKDVATQAVGSVVATAFTAAYGLMLFVGAVVITIVDLIVVVVGGAASYLVLAKVAPGLTSLVLPFWGIVFLVIAFVAIRWEVRRFARPMERGLQRTTAALSAVVDRNPDTTTARAVAERTGTPVPSDVATAKPTLAELDARLAPKEPPPG